MMHANIASEQYVQDLADLQDFQNWVKRRGDVGDVLSAIRFPEGVAHFRNARGST